MMTNANASMSEPELLRIGKKMHIGRERIVRVVDSNQCIHIEEQELQLAKLVSRIHNTNIKHTFQPQYTLTRNIHFSHSNSH